MLDISLLRVESKAEILHGPVPFCMSFNLSGHHTVERVHWCLVEVGIETEILRCGTRVFGKSWHHHVSAHKFWMSVLVCGRDAAPVPLAQQEGSRAQGVCDGIAPFLRCGCAKCATSSLGLPSFPCHELCPHSQHIVGKSHIGSPSALARNI